MDWQEDENLNKNRNIDKWKTRSDRVCVCVSEAHIRRIKTEEKAKVIALVWGKEFIQFLAALAILPKTILKNKDDFILFFQIILVQFIL